MKLLILCLFLIVPCISSASDELPNEETTVRPEFMRPSPDDKAKGYETLKLKKDNSDTESQIPNNLSANEMSSLLSKLTTTTKIEKGTLLDDLAQQVDVLKNRLVIEKTSALATQSPRKVRVNGSKTIFNYIDTAIYEVSASIDHVTDIQLDLLPI